MRSQSILFSFWIICCLYKISKYVLCLNFEVSVSEVCFYEKYCYKWEYYNYEFFNSKNCHLPDLYVPTEMLVYKVNNKVVASWIWTKRPVHDTWLSNSNWSCVYDGYVCSRGSCATLHTWRPIREWQALQRRILCFSCGGTVSSYNESRWFSSCLTLQFLNI